MKISFIAENDFANVLTEYAYCLNKHSDDIKAKSICVRPHPFNYNIQHDYDLHFCPDHQKQEAKQFLEESDIIVFGEEGHPLESTYRTLREFSNLLGFDLINSGKKLCIWHCGTLYRQNYQFYNNHPLKSKIYKHFYGMDLYRLSNKEKNDIPLHAYQYINFDKSLLLENFKAKLKLNTKLIYHIPSNHSIKGTDIINNAMTNLPSNFHFSTITNIPHPKVIEYKTKSLFYIDQFNKMGMYGVAAIEAILNSNIVFCTLHNTHEAILKLTGELVLPFIDLEKNPNQINSIVSKIINLPDSTLVEMYEAMIEWMDEYYSPNYVVKYFKNI
jgi:hypothetical protein